MVLFRYGLALASMIAIGCLTVGEASAQSGGLADMHDQRREGAKVCMTDHYHHGSSKGHKSRKEAEFEAGRDWSGFTAFEYGGSWANFRLAASREMKCDQDAGSWACTVAARPCRPGGAPTRARAKR